MEILREGDAASSRYQYRVRSPLLLRFSMRNLPDLKQYPVHNMIHIPPRISSPPVALLLQCLIPILSSFFFFSFLHSSPPVRIIARFKMELDVYRNLTRYPSLNSYFILLKLNYFLHVFLSFFSFRIFLI